MIIASSDDDPETELQTARSLVARGIDALLVSSCLNDDAALYEDFLEQGTPVIGIDRALPDVFCNVISDDRHGADLLTSSLMLDNVKHAVLLGAKPELKVSQLREQGFRDALETHAGIDVRCYYGKHYDAETGKNALEQAAKEIGSLPDIILTTSYNLLEGVIESLLTDETSSQFNSYDSLQLATFGNSRLLDFLAVPINSLPQQYELIADTAWRLAQQAIKHEYTAEQVVINRVLKKRTRQTELSLIDNAGEDSNVINHCQG